MVSNFHISSVYYPERRLTVVWVFWESIGSQLPFLKVNSDAHKSELDGGRQFPNPSVEKPDGQYEGSRFDTTSETQFA